MSCFWPDGSVASSYTVCNSKGVSSCCADGSTCLPNGLCSANLAEHYTRGACTDASFASPCVSACNDVFSNGTADLWPCSYGNNIGASGIWGCGTASVSQVCNNQAGNLGHIYSRLNNGSVVLTSTMPASNASIPNKNPPDPTESLTKLDGVAGGKSHHKARNIGLGVGLGVGIPIIALAGFLIWRMTRKAPLPPPKVLDEDDEP